jgi:hypothetical protein
MTPTTLTNAQHADLCEALDSLTAEAVALAIDGNLSQARATLAQALRRLDATAGARLAA